MEEIAAFDKIWNLRLDSQLYLTSDLIIKSNIHKDIVSATSQSVLHSDDLQFFWVLPTYSVQLFVDPQDLLLFWRAFASHQVTDFECQEIGRTRPKWIIEDVALVEEFLWCLKKAMNESIEICYDVSMQIFDNFIWKFATDFFNRVNKLISLS